MDGPYSPEPLRQQPEIGQDVVEYSGGRMVITPIEGTGRVVGSDWLGVEEKQGGKIIDTVTRKLTQEGVEIAVEQASQGYTGISAKPLEGFKMSVLHIDEDSEVPPPPVWIEVTDPNNMTNVARDRGNMLKLPPGQNFPRESYGNPGFRSGFIRVTDPEGQVRDYALGAEFKGRPDNWRVKTLIGGVKIEDFKDAPPSQET